MSACENHPEIEADLIIGNTRTGDQMFLCAADGARWGLDLAKLILSPEEIAEALGIDLTPANGAEGGAESAQAGRKRKAKPIPPEPVPEPAAAITEAGPPAAAHDGDSSV